MDSKLFIGYSNCECENPNHPGRLALCGCYTCNLCNTRYTCYGGKFLSIPIKDIVFTNMVLITDNGKDGVKLRSNSQFIPYNWGTPEWEDANCLINSLARAQIMANKQKRDFAVYKIGNAQYVVDYFNERIPNEGIKCPILNCEHLEVSRTSSLRIECDNCYESVSQDVNDNMKWKLSRELYPEYYS